MVEKLHFLLSSHDLWVACLSMDLSDVHVSINMPRSSYTMPISASEHLCGVEAFLHQLFINPQRACARGLQCHVCMQWNTEIKQKGGL